MFGKIRTAWARACGARRVFVTGMARGLSALGGVIFSVVIGRYLGPDALGIFTFSVSLILVAVIVARMGQDKLLTKQVAILVGRGDMGGVIRCMAKAVVWTLLIGGAFVLFVAMIPDTILAKGVSHDEIVSIRILSVAIPIASVAWVVSGYFKGTGASHLGVMLETGMFYLVAAPLVMLLTGWTDPSLTLFSWCFVAGAAVVCVSGAAAMSWQLLRSYQSPSNDQGCDSGGSTSNRVEGSKFAFVAIDITNFLMQSGAFLIGGFVLADTSLGLLRAAERAALLIAFVLSITNVIARPMIAHAWELSATDMVAAQGRWAARINLLVAAPIAAVAVVFPGAVLSVFGEEFSGGSGFLRLMAIAQLLNCLTGPVAQMLTMTGRERSVLYVNSWGVVLALILFSGLGGLLGGWGFAITYALLSAYRNLVLLYLVWRDLGLWYLPLPNPFETGTNRAV
jgi:O-antigen/teichoic acid export membrane protein